MAYPGLKEDLCNIDQDFVLEIKKEEPVDFPDPPTDISSGLKEEASDDWDIYPPRDSIQIIKKEEDEDVSDPPEDISTLLKEEPTDDLLRNTDASAGLKEEPRDHQDLCNSEQDFVLEIKKEETVDFPDPPRDISTGLKEEPSDDQDIYPPIDSIQIIKKEEDEDISDPPEDISTGLEEEPTDHQDITKKMKYTLENALEAIQASSEESADSEYDSDREQMFAEGRDYILDGSASEDSDPETEAATHPTLSPAEGSHQKRERSSTSTSVTSPAASSAAPSGSGDVAASPLTAGHLFAAGRTRGRGTRERSSRAPGCHTEEQHWHDVGDDDVEPAQENFMPVRQPGPQQGTRAATSPLEFFRLFFTDEVLQTLMANTNAYGAKRHEGEKESWHDISVADIFSYLAMVIYMGLVKCSTLVDYWKGSRLYSLPFPPSVISLNKFLVISRALHMSYITADEENNAKRGTPAYDRLGKIKPLYNQIAEACKSHFQPEQHIVIDERIVASKARISIKQYIRNKPSKWGYKLFVLADSGTGYTWNVFVYEGKSSTSGKGLSYDSVMSLMDFDSLGSGYLLYVDNFYTSSQLFLDLLKKKTRACGTIHKNRVGFPETTTNDFTRGTPRGTMKWIRNGELLFVKWMDAKEVVMCSTIHKAFTGDTVQRRVKKARRWAVANVPIPAPVKDHNQHMGRVYLSDALIGYYSVIHKTRKWYRTFFYHFVDIAVVNAHILYQHCRRGPAMSQKDFRCALIEELADQRSASTFQPSTSRHTARSNPAVSHKLHYFSEGQNVARRDTGTIKRRLCKLCHKKTPVGCSSCNVPLCFVATRDCFNAWHRQKGL